jgi:hypothetical protein
MGWVAEDRDGRVVASLGNIPLPYELGGKRVVAASGRGLVAEPEYGTAALLMMDSLIHQSAADLYLNNTVGPSSLAAFSAFDCDRVPAGVWDEAAFWITNRRAFFGQFPGIGRFAAVAGAGEYAWDKLLRRNWRSNDRTVESCAGFDHRFDDFWERLRAHRSEALLAVRSSAVLNWHFAQAAEEGRLWIATVPDRAGIAAYAIFERMDNITRGITRMRLVDFQSFGTSDLLLPIFRWALDRCVTEGIHILEAVGPHLEKGELLDSIAPHRRKLSNWTFFYRANDPALAERLKNRATWSPSLYDGDATL